MVTATDWSRGGTAGRIQEQYQMDALENVFYKYEKNPLGVETATRQEHVPNTHQVRSVYRERISGGGGGAYTLDPDTLHQRYDQSGNLRFVAQRRHTTDDTGVRNTLAYWMESASFYGADDKLRVHQQHEASSGTSWRGTGTYEEHRYDALGRRVLSRAREDDPALCGQDCVSTITRYVWDGNQLLHELRANGAHSLTQSALQHESSSGRHTGKVLYTHGGGIDQPLGVYREGYLNEYGGVGPFLIVPHANWRGRFDSGTYPAGVASGMDIRWPGQDDRVFHSTGSGATGRGDWFGGLLNEQKDASGLMYRRNRYYDPQTGRFTQEDPIGIAGGLNVYGYAAGDPVTYSDPYGLAPNGDCDNPQGKSEQIVCKTASKLKPWKPILDAGATYVLGMGGLALGPGGGAITRLGMAGTAASTASRTSQAVSLFRAVGQAEFDDIAAAGAFRAGPNSLEGKWFATNMQDAITWGRKFYPNQTFTVVEARLPAQAVQQMHQRVRLDNIGPAVYAEVEQLTNATLGRILSVAP